MNVQDQRKAVRAAVDEIKPAGWKTTIESLPDVHSGLIQVGHAESIAPISYRIFAVELVLTLWVDEAEKEEAATDFYALLSPGEDSIVTKLDGLGLFKGPVVVENVGPRRGPQGEGAAMFLAGDIHVTVHV